MPESIYATNLPKSVEDREYGKFELDGDGKIRVRTSGTITGTIKPTGLNTAGKVTEVTVNDTTWTALPATALSARNAIGIQNLSGQTIKINFDNAVVGFVGMVIANGSERTYDITDAIIVYAKCQSGTAVVNIEEIS